MSKAECRSYAFKKSLPILCSYIFVGMAYGMTMQMAGFGWLLSVITSLTVYTGAFQFVLITFLSSGASLLTVFLTALLMNSRQVFYGLSFVPLFSKMGARKWYMIHSLTDETYAVSITLELPEEEKKDVCFYLALFSQTYWVIGSVIGSVAGQLLPFDLTGIDFCMTALFVILFLEQWEKAVSHTPALIGLGIGVFCLVLFGANQFMLPALLLSSGLLLLTGRREERHA